MTEAIAMDPLKELATGSLHSFRDWKACSVPHVAAGLYTIWRGSDFIYVGMAGRGLDQLGIEGLRASGQQKKALFTRLASHASGRRSGDQFCVYICDRFVVPNLSQEQIEEVAAGELSLDRLTRQYVHDQLCYRFAEVESGSAALSLEAHICSYGLSGQRPLLNAGRSPTNPFKSKPLRGSA